MEIVDEDEVVSRIGQDRRIEKLVGDKPPEASDTAWRGKDAAEENKLIVAEEEDAQEPGKVHPDPALRCGEREVNLTVALQAPAVIRKGERHEPGDVVAVSERDTEVLVLICDEGEFGEPREVNGGKGSSGSLPLGLVGKLNYSGVNPAGGARDCHHQ